MASCVQPEMNPMASVFAKYQQKNWPYVYEGTLHLRSIAGGVPVNPKVQEDHIKRILTGASDDLIRAEVASAMTERGLEYDDAVEQLADEKGHVTFRSDERGLYVAGSNLKAAIKEAACIAVASGRLKKGGWGLHSSNKGVKSWIAEHVFVREDRLYLGVSEPSGTRQSFIAKMTGRGPISAIQYTDYVDDAKVDFSVETDWEFDEKDWAAIWTTGERNGLGAAKKMGYGVYSVTRWERI